jgi:V/A-type H+-transporting ATPase subunit E
MALENVINEIVSQAEKGKNEIIEQGEKEAKKILDEATKKVNEITRNFDAETEKILEERRGMELSSLNISLKKKMLEAKKSVLDEIYARLVERINKLETSKRKQLMHKLLEKAKKELPDAKFVYSRESDKELLGREKFGGVIDCLGGVIVENADKNIRVNYTFDELLQGVKEAHLNEVAKRIS